MYLGTYYFEAEVDIEDVLDGVSRDELQKYYEGRFKEDIEISLSGAVKFNPELMLEILKEEYYKNCPNGFDFKALFEAVGCKGE